MKLKTCNGCNEEKPIWKNHLGKKYCKTCWSCHNNTPKPIVSKQKPIPKISSKKAKLDKVYSVLREQFIKQHPVCQAKLNGCTLSATDIHHKYSGKNRSQYYLDSTTWMAICRNCHRWIHDNPKSAKELDYLK
jgi:hypothetical protein